MLLPEVLRWAAVAALAAVAIRFPRPTVFRSHGAPGVLVLEIPPSGRGGSGGPSGCESRGD